MEMKLHRLRDVRSDYFLACWKQSKKAKRNATQRRTAGSRGEDMERNRYRTYVPGDPRWTEYHDCLADADAEVQRARVEDARMLLVTRGETIPDVQCALVIPKSLPDSLPAI
jgi:hypothetical protein